MRLCRRMPALVAGLALAVPPHAGAATATTSDTVFGYEVAALSRQALFTRVSATWNVAAATAHTSGEEESATTFVALGDLQAGTEALVSASGTVTYRAWYQALSLSPVYPSLTVAAGDDVRGTIEQVVPGLWRITLADVTAGTSWTTTTPGAPLLPSARFLVETPVFYDEFGYAYPSMPTLDPVRFDDITIDGANPGLDPGEAVTLVAYMDLDVVGTPSAPQPDGDGFGACAWATTCAVPS